MTKEDKRQKLEAEKARYREQTQEGKKLTEQDEKELFEGSMTKEEAKSYLEFHKNREEMKKEMELFNEPVSKEVAEHYMAVHAKRNQGRK